MRGPGRVAVGLTAAAVLAPGLPVQAVVGPRLDLIAVRDLCSPPRVGLIPPTPGPEMWHRCGPSS